MQTKYIIYFIYCKIILILNPEIIIIIKQKTCGVYNNNNKKCELIIINIILSQNNYNKSNCKKNKDAQEGI